MSLHSGRHPHKRETIKERAGMLISLFLVDMGARTSNRLRLFASATGLQSNRMRFPFWRI